MTPRQERHHNWMTYAAFAAVFGLALFGQEVLPDATPDVTLSEQEAVRQTGVDWERIAKERGRKWRECHVNLTRSQTRLRRLGHRWNGDRWVRVER